MSISSVTRRCSIFKLESRGVKPNATIDPSASKANASPHFKIDLIERVGRGAVCAILSFSIVI